MPFKNRRLIIKALKRHFSTIAEYYRNLRTTDAEPVRYIQKQLQDISTIEAADVGCGSGRYTLKLFQYLGDKLYLYCYDSSKEMLAQLTDYLIQHNIKNFQTRQSIAENLPKQNASLDCVFTFNAIHLFKILDFLQEASRVLREGGYLFIYTRLRSQNRQSIWGMYFPCFYEKETRLFELEDFNRLMTEVPSLQIEQIEFFKYERVASLERLVEQATHRHYSTFEFYTKNEFQKSLAEFIKKVKRNFSDVNRITWVDGNVLFVIRKTKREIESRSR